MSDLARAGVQGFNQKQDQPGDKVPLDRMFTEIKREIELALGQEKNAWIGLKFDAAIRLHDVLISLRHWGDDIHNEGGVLNVVEGDKGDIDLATTVRSFLEDIARDMSNLWRCHEENHRIERYETHLNFSVVVCVVLTFCGSTDVEDSLMEELENSVECLRAQVEPLRTFLDSRNGSGAVAAVRKTAASWDTQRHDGGLNKEDTDKGSAKAKQDAASSLVIDRNPISSDFQAGASTSYNAELEADKHSIVNTQPTSDALGLKSELEVIRTRMTSYIPNVARPKTKYIPHGINTFEESIPYLSPYYGYGDKPKGYKGFCDFPAIWGYEIDEINLSAQNEDTILPLLQSWLFFGLLVEACGGRPMHFNTSEFITWTEEGTLVITTEMLPKYHWYWTTFSTYSEDYDERQEEMTRAETIDLCLKKANEVFERIAVQVTRFDATDEETWTRRTAVLVSISMIAEWILEARTSAVQEQRLPDSYNLEWRVPSLRKLLHHQGWCVGETMKMIEDSKTTFLCYLCSLDRLSTGKNHANCNSEEGCKASHTDYSNYKRRHVSTSLEACCCSSVGPEIHEVANELGRGNIPLVVVSGERGFHLLGYDMEKPRKYVAISHVWSHGLGNPTENRLNECMFLQIQQLVNELYDDSESPVPFWIDTMCIPPQKNLTRHQNRMRKVGIMHMAEVYEKADKVLVLDQSLQETRADVDYVEAMVRVAYSEWSTRVWTLTEGRLGSELYFQFQDRAMSIEEMVDDQRRGRNILLALESLKEMDQEDIIANSCAVLLLRAIATTTTHDSINAYYTTISSQENLKGELRRPKAEVLDLLSHLHESVSHIFQDDPVESDNILASKIRDGRIDPVIGHVADTIDRMMGRKIQSYPDVVSGRDPWGWVLMLHDVCVGLQGRKTSRLDDETICLGILLRHNAIDKILDVDTLPWGWTEVCKALGKKRIMTRCHERRMRLFLSGAQEDTENSDGKAKTNYSFPATMLFWNVARLGPLGWNWAPFSMLDPRIKSEKTRIQHTAIWTPHGLEVRLPAFELDHVRNPSTIPPGTSDVILVMNELHGRDFMLRSKRLRFHPYDCTRNHSSVSPLLSWVKTGLITQMVILVDKETGNSAIMVQKYHVKGTVHYTKHVAILESVSQEAPLEEGQMELHAEVNYIPSWERAWRVG